MISIGVDIGATSIKIGVVNERGQVTSKTQEMLGDNRSSAAVIELIRNSIAHLVVREKFYSPLAICITIVIIVQPNASSIDHIGIGCPGEIQNGVVVRAANFPSWRDVPLEMGVQNATKARVSFSDSTGGFKCLSSYGQHDCRK